MDGIQCTQCHTVAAPDARFCGMCGARLSLLQASLNSGILRLRPRSAGDPPSLVARFASGNNKSWQEALKLAQDYARNGQFALATELVLAHVSIVGQSAAAAHILCARATELIQARKPWEAWKLICLVRNSSAINFEIVRRSTNLLAVCLPLCSVTPLTESGAETPTASKNALDAEKYADDAEQAFPRIQPTLEDLQVSLAWMQQQLAKQNLAPEFLRSSAAFCELVAAQVEELVKRRTSGYSHASAPGELQIGHLIIALLPSVSLDTLRTLADDAWGHAIECWVALAYDQDFWTAWQARHTVTMGSNDLPLDLSIAGRERLRAALHELWQAYRTDSKSDSNRLRGLFVKMEIEDTVATVLHQLRRIGQPRWDAVRMPDVTVGASLYHRVWPITPLTSALRRFQAILVDGRQVRQSSTEPDCHELLEQAYSCLRANADALVLKQLGFLDDALEVLDVTFRGRESDEIRAQVLAELAQRALDNGQSQMAFERGVQAVKSDASNATACEICVLALSKYTLDLIHADPPQYDDALAAAQTAYRLMPAQSGTRFELAWTLRQKAEHLHYIVDSNHADIGHLSQTMDAYLEAWRLVPDRRYQVATFEAVADVARAYLFGFRQHHLSTEFAVSAGQQLVPILRRLQATPEDEITIMELEQQGELLLDNYNASDVDWRGRRPDVEGYRTQYDEQEEFEDDLDDDEWEEDENDDDDPYAYEADSYYDDSF